MQLMVEGLKISSVKFATMCLMSFQGGNCSRAEVSSDKAIEDYIRQTCGTYGILLGCKMGIDQMRLLILNSRYGD